MILYVGSYTEIVEGNFGGHGDGIYCFDFDPANGKLQIMHVQPAINPSYLCIRSGKYLYTHTELTEAKKPRVLAFKINTNDFSLQLMNEQEIAGGFPCHIAVSNKNNCILVACYETGNAIIFPVATDGKLLPHKKIAQQAGSGPNKLRQQAAHAHAVAVDDIFNNIFVADLGIDKVMIYDLCIDGTSEAELKQSVSLPPGSGPRHIAFHAESEHAFVLNELTGTVTIMRYRNGNLEPRRTCSLLPEGSKVTPGASAIRISADGKFIYTGERGDNTITVSRFDSSAETVEIVQRQKTPGKTPRDIVLDPTGSWLLVAHQDSDSIAIFKVDKNSGMITKERLFENIKSPACLEWLPEK